MGARLLLLGLVVFSACGPALTMRRLQPPRVVLGTARTVRVEVVPASVDAVPEGTEPVSAMARRAISERIAAAGYQVCEEAGCGDGVFRVVLEDLALGPQLRHRPTFAMLDEAMRVARGGQPAAPAPGQVEVALQVRLSFLQADKVGFSSEHSSSASKPGTLAGLVRELVEGVARSVGEALSRQAPLMTLQLEGGELLNRGLAMFHAGDWAGATAYFQELTRTHPELDGAWYDLGVALEAQNAWGPAREAYEAALQRAQKPHYQQAAEALRKAMASRRE